MCPPGCFHSICENATRRGLLKAGFTLGLGAAAAAALPVGKAALAAPTSFSETVDLSHADDIKAWEARNGRLPDGCCVIMNSGWHKLVGDAKFAGRDAEGKNHTPGFHIETVQMLIAERNVKGIGVDTLSLDTGLNSGGAFPVHYEWLGSGRWGVEAVANLDAIPESGAQLFLGIPKVKGATGGPTRVIALL